MQTDSLKVLGRTISHGPTALKPHHQEVHRPRNPAYIADRPWQQLEWPGISYAASGQSAYDASACVIIRVRN